MKFWREPLDKDEIVIPHGRLYVIPDRCKGCGFCIEFCPQKVLVESEDRNKKGYHPPKLKEGCEYKCITCEFCLLICPEFAIYSKSKEEDEEQVSEEENTAEVSE